MIVDKLTEDIKGEPFGFSHDDSRNAEFTHWTPVLESGVGKAIPAL